MTGNYLDFKKNHSLSGFTRNLTKTLEKVYKSYLFEVFLMLFFTYFTLLTSWYFSVSIFFFYFDFFPKFFVNNSDLLILVIFLAGFCCYVFHKMSFRRWHEKNKKIIKFEKLVENAVYIVSLLLSLIIILFSFAFDKESIAVFGITIICSFIFYMVAGSIFVFCIKNDSYKTEYKRKILFLFSFSVVYLIFDNMSVFDEFIFDNTSLLMRDISKIKRGWILVKSLQVYGHLLSMLFILCGTIFLPSLVKKHIK